MEAARRKRGVERLVASLKAKLYISRVKVTPFFGDALVPRTSMPSSAVEATSLEVLQRIAEELRRHGIRARVRLDWRGTLDLYVLEEDAALLDRLCDEGRLSEEARRLLC
jgi:hypothetical protein